MTRQEAEVLLKKQFGLERFYDTQWDVIQKIVRGERVLLIEKTGYGKSLCFQFPSVIFKGTTVVFSPLIALMRDQVNKLSSSGISAACINSNQTEEENQEILEKAKSGEIKILYIAPERQDNNEWIEATRSINLSMIVIDEAHCVSVWGHDFRPAFRRIINLVKLMPSDLPVIATTATATPRVEKDIAQQIGGGITVVRGKLLRENFMLYVIRVNSEDEKMIWLGKNLPDMDGSGIIYTGTRVNTEIYSRWLSFLKIEATSYNAGLDAESRIVIERGLISNRWKCIISTNALGMGIDKPDIRFIIHTQIPQSPIHYYQEIGRAGRDGLPTEIILFFNSEDKSLPLAFIDGGRPSVRKYQQVMQAIHNEPLGEKDLMRKTNLKQTPIRVIRSDLIEQGIIREANFGKSRKLEYVTGAPELNVASFEELRRLKTIELEKMLEYVETSESRMKFLCEFLGDQTSEKYSNCDNTGLKKKSHVADPSWDNKLKEFREDYFPVIEVESTRSKIVNGIASSYYGVSNVGAAIHRSKYENGGEFPDFLLILTLRAFRKKFCDEQFDLLVYVPPTKSGNLVKVFAEKLSGTLKIPISHDLIKNRITEEQKIFENHTLKNDNVCNAFEFRKPEEISGKKILLVDDVYDSGATIKEIGRYFTNLGAEKIAPLVIAKTVGGDLND
jgi:ATP-dependent DNA helicase RecQ